LDKAVFLFNTKSYTFLECSNDHFKISNSLALAGLIDLAVLSSKFPTQ